MARDFVSCNPCGTFIMFTSEGNVPQMQYSTDPVCIQTPFRHAGAQLQLSDLRVAVRLVSGLTLY